MSVVLKVLVALAAVFLVCNGPRASACECELVASMVGQIQVCPKGCGDQANVGVTQTDPGYSTGSVGDTGSYTGDPGPVIDIWQIAQDCVGRGALDDGCRFISDGGDRFAQPPPVVPVIDVPAVAREASASLQVPAPVLVVGPDPAANKWGTLAVGLPVWIWADDTGPVATTVSQDGIDIAMTASRGAVTVDWGDGTTTVCNTMTPRPAGIDPLASSPDCGHTYLHKGDYVVSASAAWNVSWQAAGTSGTLGLSSTGQYPLAIREFSSVVVG